jgi:hypothetical protein
LVSIPTGKKKRGVQGNDRARREGQGDTFHRGGKENCGCLRWEPRFFVGRRLHRRVRQKDSSTDTGDTKP